MHYFTPNEWVYKLLENGSKNMSFQIKGDEVWDKYNKLWDVIKDKLDIEIHSESVFEYKYLKTEVREFDDVIKTNFLDNDMPKENMHSTWIACIAINSVMRIDKKIIRKFIQKSVNIGPRKYKCLDL